MRSVGELLERRRIAGLGQRARPAQYPHRRGVWLRPLHRSRDDRTGVRRASQTSRTQSYAVHQTAGVRLKGTCCCQRKLRPVTPGRCTLLPSPATRPPLALPSSQRARIYQELNHLRILNASLGEQALTLAQRDTLAAAPIGTPSAASPRSRSCSDCQGLFNSNFEDPKRQELKGNTTNAILAMPNTGPAWSDFNEAKQRRHRSTTRDRGERSGADRLAAGGDGH